MSEVANAIKPFPLGGLPKTDIAAVKAAAERIRAWLQRQIKDIIDIGRDLLMVKDKLDHGKFERWLDEEFALSLRSAQRYMRAAKFAEEHLASKNDNLTLLPSALYMLSAPSTPMEATQRVIEHIDKHGRVESNRVKAIITESKVKATARDRRRPPPSAGKKAQTPLSARAARAHDRRLKKQEAERQERHEAAVELAARLAEILVHRLEPGEVALLLESMDNWAGRQTLREELDKAQTAAAIGSDARPAFLERPAAQQVQ